MRTREPKYKVDVYVPKGVLYARRPTPYWKVLSRKLTRADAEEFAREWQRKATPPYETLRIREV